VLPAAGLRVGELDRIQKEILRVAHRITPQYHPVVEPYVLGGKNVLVLWAPGGQNRPYKAPISAGKNEKSYAYYVRLGSSTVRATGPVEAELLQLAANVPFDDRMRHDVEISDLSLHLIQAHLQQVKSDLFEASGSMDFGQLCTAMQIVDGPPENLRPRNVGILFFTNDPSRFIPPGADRRGALSGRQGRRDPRKAVHGAAGRATPRCALLRGKHVHRGADHQAR
jgi:ATP-dependent DNA helicase RecG